MSIELENAKACCRQSINQIERIVGSTLDLASLLAVLPNQVTFPPARVTWITLLWRLGTGLWSWRKLAPEMRQKLEPIAAGRVRMIADLEILRHMQSNEEQLATQWSKIREEFNGS